MPFFLLPSGLLTNNKQKSKNLIIFCNVLKINILFSNSRFLPRFLPQMYIYIGSNTIIDFCHVPSAKKRIFEACKIVTFCNGDRGGAPPATTDHRPTVTPQDFMFFKLIQ